MKKILLILIGLIAVSCTKEIKNISLPVSSSDRLVFQNFDELNQTYKSLAKMKSRDELLYWAQCKNHSTLLTSSDTTIQIYSSVLRTLLNKDSEFELGDKTIWFNNGDLYSLPKNKQSINSFKCNPDSSAKIGWISVKSIIEKNPKGAIIWNNGSPEARNQHQFTQSYRQSCGGSLIYGVGTRKYVHEVWGESWITYNGGCGCYHIYSNLWLRIKLEWKGSGSWKIASEQRNIKLENLQGTAWWGNPHTYVASLDIPDEVDSCFTSNGNLGSEKNVWLTGLDGDLYQGQDDLWDLTLTGTIYQHVLGDYSWNSWWNGPYLWN